MRTAHEILRPGWPRAKTKESEEVENGTGK